MSGSVSTPPASITKATRRCVSWLCGVVRSIVPGDSAWASDEGVNIPRLLGEAAHGVIDKVKGSRRVLALLDAAYCEKAVVDELIRQKWLYLICANQNRRAEQLAHNCRWEWKPQGPDVGRGWIETQVARSNTCPRDGPSLRPSLSAAGVRATICPDIGTTLPLHQSGQGRSRARQGTPVRLCRLSVDALRTKQGHENHFKPLLSDLGGHHPASGRWAQRRLWPSSLPWLPTSTVPRSWRTKSLTSGTWHPSWRTRRDYSIAGRVIMKAGRVPQCILPGPICPTDANVCGKARLPLQGGGIKTCRQPSSEHPRTHSTPRSYPSP